MSTREVRAGLAVSVFAGIVFGAAAFAEGLPAVAPGHVVEPQGLYQGALHGYTPNSVAGGTVVDTAALATLIETKHPVLLDVAAKDRKPPSMGKDMPWFPHHRTIAGAVFLQDGGDGSSDPAFAAAFKARVAALTGGDKGKPVVTFCHPDCWGSYNAAKRLAGLGYTRVYWYRDGLEGWQDGHDTAIEQPDAEWLASMPRETAH